MVECSVPKGNSPVCGHSADLGVVALPTNQLRWHRFRTQCANRKDEGHGLAGSGQIKRLPTQIQINLLSPTVRGLVCLI